LIEEFSEQPPGEAPAGRTIDGRWWKLVFDIRLASEERR
jgi:hypothetical protein